MADKENPLWDALKEALDRRGVRHVTDWPAGAHVSLFWKQDTFLVVGVYNSRPPHRFWGLQSAVVDAIVAMDTQAMVCRFLFQDEDAGGVLVTSAQLRRMLPGLSHAQPVATDGRRRPLDEALGLGSRPRLRSLSYKVEPRHLPSSAPHLRSRAIVDELEGSLADLAPDPAFDPVVLVHPERRDRWSYRVQRRLKALREGTGEQ